ncbi:MAG: aminodeoxychorismate/anthranilate synthase component II [Alphaproteobacteria bacterium]|nr:aminodeoxychorismate/anthranilate synthase component II [Alphaproteobacteria bacterium]
MLVLIDNYDSFTYNLVQYFGDLGETVDVFRNDHITANEVLSLKPDGIIISPGPSDPDHAGICLEMIEKAAAARVPLFGVCLGHQAIGQVFGGKVIRAPEPVHGKVRNIHHTGKDIFRSLPSPFSATRYHSLIVERESLPDELVVTAETDDGLIMGLSHRSLPVYGVQFHPESYATENGHSLLSNFLQLTKISAG